MTLPNISAVSACRRLAMALAFLVAVSGLAPAGAALDVAQSQRLASPETDSVRPAEWRSAYHMSSGKKSLSKSQNENGAAGEETKEKEEPAPQATPEEKDDSAAGSRRGDSTKKSKGRRKAIKRKKATRKKAVRKKATRKKIRSKIGSRRSKSKKRSRLTPSAGVERTSAGLNRRNRLRPVAPLFLVRRTETGGDTVDLSIVARRPVPRGRRICLRLDLGLAADCRF